jgi:L-lysine exporter family protein LysE/ArgO
MAIFVSFSAFLYGLPVGFAFSFALGPVFFSLIKASLDYGFRAAVSIALGVIFADLVLLAIAFGGVEAFLPKTTVDVTFWVQLLGGLLLLGLGLATMLKKRVYTEGSPLTHERRIFKHISMGFLLNIVNPANFFEWMGTASVLKTKYHFEAFENVSFFTGALLAVFLTELAVAYFAVRLKKKLNQRVIQNINFVTGVLFIGTGLWLFWEAVH